jgi:hypothetical protein
VTLASVTRIAVHLERNTHDPASTSTYSLLAHTEKVPSLKSP